MIVTMLILDKETGMANLNYNKAILGGRLTETPTLKSTPGGTSLCEFRLAVNRSIRSKDSDVQETDFFTVVVWRQQAEAAVRYLRRGSCVLITGTLHNRTWTAKNGEKRFRTELVAQEIKFVDSKKETENDSERSLTQENTPHPNWDDAAFEDVPTDYDVPF